MDDGAAVQSSCAALREEKLMSWWMAAAALGAAGVIAAGCGSSGGTSSGAGASGSCSGPAVTLECPTSPLSAGSCTEIIGMNMDYSVGGAETVTFNGQPGTFNATGGPDDVEMCAPTGLSGKVTMVYTNPSGCSASCDLTVQ
jgi:hypothetical protein